MANFMKAARTLDRLHIAQVSRMSWAYLPHSTQAWDADATGTRNGHLRIYCTAP